MVDLLICGLVGLVEYWSIGVLECWSIGVLEYWSIGVLECSVVDLLICNSLILCSLNFEFETLSLVSSIQATTKNIPSPQSP
jgi:hypothetical protein